MATFILTITKSGSTEVIDTYIVEAVAEYKAVLSAVERLKALCT